MRTQDDQILAPSTAGERRRRARLHDRPTLASRVTRSSSSCSNVSLHPPVLPDAIPSSKASSEGYRSCMTTSVSAPRSSNVTVVTVPLSPPSSFVQTRRECGVTSLYLPKNAMGSGEAGWLNTKRYVPPVRTSISQESRDRANDFGTHQRLNSSGLVQASNTMRAGPLKIRATTNSRSDVRSTVVRFFTAVGSLSFFASIDLLLAFEFLDNIVQLLEAQLPE